MSGITDDNLDETDENEQQANEEREEGTSQEDYDEFYNQ